MTYQVLARKWRPRNFQQMVGQAPLLRMLTNALAQKRLHHAYLFTGTRGVGKTTLARIFAKSLNCQIGITNQPCGECDICLAIDNGRFVDLYEVDAASRTKVEDTRDLLENVPYPPNHGRYKVYLIDEVHMLSNHSFNALLKTLEEPPEHVKFILATTDPKRLPITILSRCLQFHLKKLSSEEIAKHLEFICKTENIPAETVALNKLAQAADGSMRDALSLLDQAIAYSSGSITQETIFKMLGCMGQDEILPLLQALAHGDGPALFAAINEIADRGPNYEQLLNEILCFLHKIAVAQTVVGAIELPQAWQALATDFNPEDVQLYYQIALLGRRDLVYSPAPQLGFEMIMLRMLAFKPQSNVNIVRLKQEPNINDNPSADKVEQLKEVVEATAPASQQQWRDLLANLKLTGLAYALASNCTLVQWQENKIQLALALAHQPMLNEKLKQRIAQALNNYLQKDIQLEITVTSEELNTPSRQAHQEEQQLLTQAKEKILQDPNLKRLIELYDATVEVSLIT